MADIKTKEELLAELKLFLKVQRSDIDSGDNSLIKDIVLTPYSVGGANIMTQVGIARDLGILSKLYGIDVDNEATNYGLERLTGNYSLCYVTFYANSTPGANITIPAGIDVGTIGTTFSPAVEFTTLSQAIYPLASINNYYNFDRARFEFTVRCICSTIGSIGNCASGLILRLNTSVANIDGVENITSATGGQDAESDEDLKLRIKLAKTGRELNTVNGLRKFVNSLGFRDSYPVRPESVDAEKSFGIDVFVINTSEETFTDTFTFDSAQDQYYFTHRPALTLTNVEGSITGIIAVGDYHFHIDATSPLRRSIDANDYVKILISAGMIDGEILTLTYTYASMIYNSQTVLDSNENDILTSDPLLKRAYPLLLDINAKLNLKANADGPTTRNRVKSALSQFLTTYRLGDDIQKSDLIIVLQNGYGDYPITSVDSVVINTYTLLDENGVYYTPVDEIIDVNDKCYVIYGTATII